MASATENAPQSEKPEAATAVPDYMLDPDAVIKDDVTWRHGAPNYSKTRVVYQATKKSSHAPGSLESMVENLVKNWEIEASHKIRVSDWRTVDPDKYTFAINGGQPQDAEHMLKVGTYNAIITAPNQYYDSSYSDFEKSHKTFREMMPVFTWEVLEVYSPPPTVAFKWRHWGEMKADYVGWNNKGEKVTLQAHNGSIDIQGLTVAKLNDKFQVTSLETWFDPLEMFHQMIPKAVQPPNSGETKESNNPMGDGEIPSMIDQQGPHDDGTNGFTQELAEQIETSEPLAASEEVKLINPSILVNGQHDEAKELSETKEACDHQEEQTSKRPRVMESDSLGIAAAGIGSCPFLSGQHEPQTCEFDFRKRSTSQHFTHSASLTFEDIVRLSSTGVAKLLTEPNFGGVDSFPPVPTFIIGTSSKMILRTLLLLISFASVIFAEGNIVEIRQAGAGAGAAGGAGAGAGAGGDAEDTATATVSEASYELAYTMQTGLTRYAPMPPLAVTSITAKSASMQYPTSSFSIATTYLSAADADVTVTQSQTFSTSTIQNTASAAANPTDTAMARFLNRWKD